MVLQAQEVATIPGLPVECVTKTTTRRKPTKGDILGVSMTNYRYNVHSVGPFLKERTI